MGPACAHLWDRWRTVIPSFDYAGRFVGATIAELHADEPVRPGWTRTCGRCGTLQTAYEAAGVDVAGGDVEEDLLHLARVRALVREHPADAVPVLELAEVARAAGVEL